MLSNIKYTFSCYEDVDEEIHAAFYLRDCFDTSNIFFFRCLLVLKEDHQIKVVNALQTLCALFRCVFKKKFNDFGYDVINVIVGFEEAENSFQQLIQALCKNHNT